MQKMFAIGADIGGSHVSTAVIGLESGKMVDNSLNKKKVDNKASAGEILNSWAAVIEASMKTIPVAALSGISFAMPGPFDYQKGIALMDKSVAKYENLYGLNIGNELKKLLNLPPELPFRYINDARAFAIGECWIGRASEFENVVAITLGTGFGSAFLTGGIPVTKGSRVPAMGYLYHIAFENSIADDYFSSRWLLAEYKKRTGIACSGVKEIAEGKYIPADSVKLFEDFGNNIGDFLAPFLLKFNAGCLVIGGNITGAYNLFGPAMETSLKYHGIFIPVIIPQYPELKAIAGSVRLLQPSFRDKIKI